MLGLLLDDCFWVCIVLSEDLEGFQTLVTKRWTRFLGEILSDKSVSIC